MDYLLNFKLECDDIAHLPKDPINQVGDETTSSQFMVRSSKNEQVMYIDGAFPDPLFLGFVKSRGDQSNKQPVEANDFLGGIQAYGRIVPGDSLGYCAAEYPLAASLMFKVADYYNKESTVVPTELVVALTNEEDMRVKLIFDSHGSLKITGDVHTGDLTITDEVVENVNKEEVKYVKVMHDGKEYAMPLYAIA